MNQKILIGSIFVALVLLLSMPFVSTLQASSPILLDECNIFKSEPEDNLGYILIVTYTHAYENVFQLGGVVLVLKNDGRTVRTGITGFFGHKCFTGLSASGTYTITASARNFRTKTVNVDFGITWIEMVGGNPDDIEVGCDEITSQELCPKVI